MKIETRQATASDVNRYPELFWVGPSVLTTNIAIRFDSRDNKWYVTDGLISTVRVIAGPIETKDAAQATAEMLWLTGVLT